jgi:guanylate kinase
MVQAEMFDYAVVNHKVEDAVAEIMDIIAVEKVHNEPKRKNR